MKFLFRASLLACTVTLFAGCGGGSDGGPSLAPGENNNAGGGGSTGGGGTGTTADQIVRFGSISNGNFSAGVIASNKSSVEAGTSASLSVTLIDQNDSLVTDATDILFSSACAGSGLAEFQPAIASNNSGTVTTTYTTRGCSGDDKITAQTSIDGTSYSATVTIQTIPAPLGSISFVSANPQTIGIKGSGAIAEQSVVTFKVTNTAGGPVANQDVSFELNNTTGGITLNDGQSTTAQATTDANGETSVTVASGSVSTSVRITATADQGTKTSSSQSSALVITTGLPDQDSFSLAATVLNIEGWSYDGETTELTIRAADRYNNPAPDNTAIAFQAEGAAIEGSCVLQNGACSVTLTSQNPRSNLSDGRVTVLATAIGEESFNDTTPSNGQFDDAETFADLGEAFRDDDEDNTYDQNTEPFVDFNNNGSRDGPSGKFEGLLCNGPNKCNATQTTTTIREDLVIILSGSSFNIDGPSSISLGDATTAASASFSFEIYDVNGQVPPAGTTIKASTDQGELSGVTSYDVPSTNYNQLTGGNLQYGFTIKPGSKAGSGTFTLTIETPRGIISRAVVPVTQLVDKP
jgi:hypothetical protein